MCDWYCRFLLRKVRSLASSSDTLFLYGMSQLVIDIIIIFHYI